MLHSTNIRMLQKHSKVATFEGSFESDTFVYALIRMYVCLYAFALPTKTGRVKLLTPRSLTAATLNE